MQATSLSKWYDHGNSTVTENQFLDVTYTCCDTPDIRPPVRGCSVSLLEKPKNYLDLNTRQMVNQLLIDTNIGRVLVKDSLTHYVAYTTS
jgi:hypothetical protein